MGPLDMADKKGKKVETKEATGGSQQRWYIVDADGKVLGRMATRIATVLRGKDRPDFAPNKPGDGFVVCINAAKVRLTGRKWEQKKYYRHSGYFGGLKEATAAEMLRKKPEELVLHAVKGMLPKNRLGRKLLTRLRVYAGPEHPHTAQKPEPLNID